MNKQNIVLIGFRGCGKTSIGRAMAKKKNIPFADIEEQIEFIIDEPIAGFVERNGWQVFREIEQKVAHDFCRNFSGILATGSGTIENSKNLQNLKKTGVFAFLNTDFTEVKSYLLNSKEEQSRPRFNTNISLSEEITQMWEQRKGIYGAIAEIEVQPTLKKSSEEEAEKLITTLESVLPKEVPKKRIAIFSSSNGTTFQGVLDAQKKGRIPNIEFTLFVTDKPKAGVVEKAKKAGIKNIQIFEQKKGESREDYDRPLINAIRENNPDLVLLMGWMKIFSPLYCEQFGNITYNVHPSLLPKFAGSKGDEVHQKVLEYEERYTGCTIHRVTAEVDAGETVLQRKVLVDENDGIEELRKKVQKQEILGFCEVLERR